MNKQPGVSDYKTLKLLQSRLAQPAQYLPLLPVLVEDMLLIRLPK
jgi:hypothetical protein